MSNDKDNSGLIPINNIHKTKKKDKVNFKLPVKKKKIIYFFFKIFLQLSIIKNVLSFSNFFFIILESFTYCPRPKLEYSYKHNDWNFYVCKKC